MAERKATGFRRDRLTWVAYLVLAWFAYLQAAPGLVIGHLRDELDLSYSTGGLHEAAFAAGSLLAGAVGFSILWPSHAPAQAVIGLALLGIGLGNLFPLGLSVTVALAPGRAGLASGRAVVVTSFAVLLAPLTVGTLADAASLTAALGVVPVVLVLAAAALTFVRRASRAARALP